MKNNMIGFQEARRLTIDHIKPLRPAILPLKECANHCSASDIQAKVDSPSANVSLKDGYAVRSEDIKSASITNPVTLRISDMAAAGIPSKRAVDKDTTIQVLTGAKIPENADTVLAEEYITKRRILGTPLGVSWGRP